MPDTFTEVSSRSWFSRIGDSIKGIFFGFLLILGAIVLLWWNEGRAIRRIKTLREGLQAVIPVSADSMDSANAGKLVQMSGLATTTETLADYEFGVSANALKLERDAEMYQWVETEKTHTQKNLGGGTTTTKTYDYQQGWRSGRIDSNHFKHPEGHANPAIPYSPREFVAGKITVGAFTLSPELVAKINGHEALPVTSTDSLPAPLRATIQLVDGKIYIGSNSASPVLGDERVSFRVVKPVTVSLVAQQTGNTFKAYRSKVGGSVELLQVGEYSADQMFAHARENNRLLTWGLRLLGWLLMYFGFRLLFAPLEVLADFIPILGSIVGFGTGMLAFFLSAPLSLLVVAVAWIYYRPLFGLALIAVAVAIPVLIHKQFKKKPPVTTSPA